VIAHDQARFPLATLLLVARERATPQRVRLISLARCVSDERALHKGIPPIE
jgi:hypothetical protein